MANISNRKIIVSRRRSEYPDFREPDVDVVNRDFSRARNQIFARQIIDSSDFSSDISQIGTPINLEKIEERIVKKGPSTFIDVFIEFDPAPGAEYHEFRVSKITVEEEQGE